MGRSPLFGRLLVELGKEPVRRKVNKLLQSVTAALQTYLGRGKRATGKKGL